jgi:branched-chain amino acid transport system substrate-binding protein
LLYVNSDWGRTAKDAFAKAAADFGAPVVANEGFLAAEQDFRSTLLRVRDAKPDGLVLISYYSDGALISRQARDAGLTLPIVASSPNYSPKFIELGGAGVEGVYTLSSFFRMTPDRRCKVSYSASGLNTTRSPTPSTPVPMTR